MLLVLAFVCLLKLVLNILGFAHLSLMSCLLTNEQRKTLSIDIDEKTTTNKPRLEISNNVVYATSKDSDQPAHTRSLIRTFASRSNILSVKLLTEHHLEFLSFRVYTCQNATLLEIT